MEILDELPTSVGLELFARLRDVIFWVSSPESVRSELFARDREFPPPGDLPRPIADSISTLRALISRPSTAETIGNACAAVAAWAYDSGLIGTAIAFAHVTARVFPESPEAAFAVGRATRDAGRYVHSDAWFNRALGLARRARSVEMKARVYIGWGVLEELRGNPAAARRRFEKALTTAAEMSLPSITAHAHQFMIAHTSSDLELEKAFAHAVTAARLYSDDDPDLPWPTAKTRPDSVRDLGKIDQTAVFDVQGRWSPILDGPNSLLGYLVQMPVSYEGAVAVNRLALRDSSDFWLAQDTTLPQLQNGQPVPCLRADVLPFIDVVRKHEGIGLDPKSHAYLYVEEGRKLFGPAVEPIIGTSAQMIQDRVVAALTPADSAAKRNSAKADSAGYRPNYFYFHYTYQE